jgi:hypothetical protein
MKVNRNNPCPCGSSKKYKKCCMNKDSVFIHTYKVTYDPFPDDENKLAMAEDDRKLLHNIGECIVNDGDVEISFVKDLLHLKEKYPKVRETYNYLSVIYSTYEEDDKSVSLLLETYEKMPEYFFAKVNMASHYIQKGQHKKITEIFPTFDLHEIFPGKEVFHAAEIVSFLVLLGRYYLREQNLTSAKNCLNIVEDIEYDQSTIDVLAMEIEKFEEFFVKVVKDTILEEVGEDKLTEMFKGIDKSGEQPVLLEQ